MKRLTLLAALMLGACQTVPSGPPPSASLWITTADGTQKLARQADVVARPPVGPAPAVTIDRTQRYQLIQGFGASITDASAELIGRLSADRRRALLLELFGRQGEGLGLSFTRLTVGASDFSRTHYSYDDTPGNVPDPAMRHFSIAPARQYVLPVTREALAINRDLIVMISPWSAPAWMKTSKSLIKGRLNPAHYASFAEYFARTIEAFGREGVPASLLSIQNEPDFEPENYPGMRMSPAERAAVVGKHLGPLLERRGIKTRILDWDHNWDKPEQPLGVLADPVARRYIAGSPGTATPAMSPPRKRSASPIPTRKCGSPNAPAASGRRSLVKRWAG
ncbi:glycoside hydrolase family 30 protein [Sphingomonas rhizophila]|uniref:glycoside hydrolase family 30 protein n=1 Tax=Sphingomonas rhizophila TaxID=2071607 RepID=UPI001CB6FD1C|nr:hypothetical protein [Sphingomonas rhizophila]